MKIALILVFTLMQLSLTAISGFDYSNVLSCDTVDPSVQILSPQNVDFIQQNSPLLIEWSVSDAHQAESGVFVFFSEDGGLNFNPIGYDFSVNDIFVWITPSGTIENSMIRIEASDTFGNIGACQSPESFVIGPLIPLSPENLVLTPLNPIDMQISWEPVTLGSFGQAIQVEGYLVFYSESSPTDVDSFYLLEDVVDGCSCIHLKAMEHWDKMFYKVYAYVSDGPPPPFSPIFRSIPVDMQQKVIRRQQP